MLAWFRELFFGHYNGVWQNLAVKLQALPDIFQKFFFYKSCWYLPKEPTVLCLQKMVVSSLLMKWSSFVPSCPILSCPVLSYSALLSCPVLYTVPSCPVCSCPLNRFCPVHCPVLSCLIPSHPVHCLILIIVLSCQLSRPVLSCTF